MPRQGLTEKQERFAQLYVELGNARQAYVQSYNQGRMSWAVVDQRAFGLRRHPGIAARIAELKAELLKRHEVTVDRIIQELALIAFANMLDYVEVQPDGTARIDLNKISHDQGAVISELAFDDGGKFKFKLSDKQGALEKLGKHLGMFPTQVSGKDNGPVQIQLVKGDEQL